MASATLREQVSDLTVSVAELRRRQSRWTEATVTAVDTVTNTITVQTSDGQSLGGIAWPAAFLPDVGQVVHMPVVGGQPMYQANGVAADAITAREISPGAVGYTELQPVVGGDISAAILNSTNAVAAANGKNKVIYSTADASGSGTVAGDPWFKRDATTGVISASWEWTGTAWAPRTFGDQVLASLTAGKITSGTINTDILVAGQVATGTSGQRAGINSLGVFAYNSSGVKTVDLNGVTNLLTGTLQTALTGRRIVTGASGSTGEITFYPASGTQTSYIKSITETAGVEAVQLGLVSGQTSDSPLWNRLNINSDEWTNLRSNKIDLNYLTGGVFVIRELSSRNVSATATARMQIDASQTLLWAPDNLTVYQLGNGAHTFYPANQSTSGWIKVRPNLITDTNFRTPYIEWATDNNGVSGAGAYTGVVKFIMRSGGVNPAFQFRNGADTAYYPIEASAFNVATSHRAVKRGIRDLTDEATPLIRRTPVRRYELLDADLPGERIGLIIEESPALILDGSGDAIDLYRTIALLWKAVQELDARFPGGPRVP